MSTLVLRPHHAPAQRRHVLVVALASLALVAALVVLGGVLTGDGGSSVRDVPARSVSPVDAIDRWLATNRDQVFPGAEGPFLGTCPSGSSQASGICSSLREDLGDVQLHIVGVHATDWGADLLLERRSEDAWVVTGVSPWPQLGTRYDGSPWSPLTAITTWWYDEAAARFGEGAVHLRSCSDAADAQTAQPLLCSVLVDAGDGVRTYTSGLAGSPPAIELTVVERPDHTWLVAGAMEIDVRG
jgi:hypothetical protein